LGVAFTAGGPQGEVVVEVTSVEGATVTIDGNHPLADVTLAFSGEITDIREATQGELEHGHVHGPSCNH